MRKLFVPAALVMALAVGSAATAATKPAPSAAKPATAASSKSADCMRQWSSQKKHTETRKAFLAACEKA